MWRKIWSVLIVVGAWQRAALGQSRELSSIFDRLTQQVGEQLDEKDFYPKAQEVLWDVYAQGDSLKPELVDFVKHGADGPRLCFAGLALIAFHDAATVRPMLERAMDPHTSPATRECFREATAALLGGADVVCRGKGEVDVDRTNDLNALIACADAAAKSSIGHYFAQELNKAMLEPDKSGEYWEGLAYLAANLAGILDLKDEQLLEPGLTSPDRFVFQTTMVSLGYAVNRDFLGNLVNSKDAIYETKPEERAAGKAADKWWQKYLHEHPDGDWRPAVIAGFQDADYKIEKDYSSFRSQQELLRALDDSDRRIRYNAYRLLNAIYHTHFDLHIAFVSARFERGEDFPDHSPSRDANEARLKKYWQKRLG
jgi:hypothetical protein